MNHEPEDSGIRSAEEIDTGEPIAALAQFEHDTSSDLIVRVRRTIQRRTTVGQLTYFATSTPLVVLKEFWLLLNRQLEPVDTRKDINHGEKAY
jgi:hypothetical protein